MNTTILEPQNNSRTTKLNPNTWVDKYFDYLHMYTIKRVRCSDQAKDLVQDTFMAALNSAKYFKGNSTERTWLVGILKRKIVDHYRKINSKKGRAEVSMNNWRHNNDEMNWFEEFVADPQSITGIGFMENEELGLMIENCIAKLPKRYAQAFTLRTIKGYSTEVICEIMDINQSNLWVILHRSRTALKECIEQNWYQYNRYNKRVA